MNWIVRIDPELEDLIPAFLDNRRNELIELEAAVAGRNFEFIRRLAHTWKGICRPYGFNHLETLSFALEVASERESVPEIAAVVREIRAYLETVRFVQDV